MSHWQGVTTAMGCDGEVIHDDGTREHIQGCHGEFRTDYDITTFDKNGKLISKRREITDKLTGKTTEQ